ncbi:MAG: guanine deaminase [Hyphomicrobiales bacterium]|nr:guanine deaminase [Hyphomicrobiales bacterium]
MSVTAHRGAITALRGTLLYCRDDPFLVGSHHALVEVADGLVVCRDGVIEAVGPYATLMASLPPEAEVTDYSGCLITPGLIDTHIHYVQTGVIGAQGHRLLDWLNNYIYPAEQAFADMAVARDTAELFCDELLRNGTTTALVFCSVHAGSVEALFEAASVRNMRLIAGKVLMDRHAPAALTDTAQSGYDQSKALIERWHGRGRCLYAITPRFAATSTPEQLALAGTLWREHPGAFVHTHIAESRDEIAWIGELYPQRRDYLDVYEHHGLTGRRAVLAHGVHLAEEHFGRCHASGTALAHCPTSNMFLGSGLFPLRRARDPRRPVEVGLATDIGAGTSFSLLATMSEAYKVAQLAGGPVDVVEAFFLATLGGARALALDDRIGTLAPGHEADMVVLDPQATPLIAFRTRRAHSFAETLAVLATLADDRVVRATYVAGQLAHRRG